MGKDALILLCIYKIYECIHRITRLINNISILINVKNTFCCLAHDIGRDRSVLDHQYDKRKAAGASTAESDRLPLHQPHFSINI